VVVGSLLLVVVAASGTLVVLVAAALPSPLPLPLSARASAGDPRKARMQIEIATSWRWMRLERVEVQHRGVPTDLNRSPFEPSRKKLPVCLSPPRRRVLISSLDRTPRPWDIQ
jgi:hypothetical protein